VAKRQGLKDLCMANFDLVVLQSGDKDFGGRFGLIGGG